MHPPRVACIPRCTPTFNLQLRPLLEQLRPHAPLLLRDPVRRSRRATPPDHCSPGTVAPVGDCGLSLSEEGFDRQADRQAVGGVQKAVEVLGG